MSRCRRGPDDIGNLGIVHAFVRDPNRASIILRQSSPCGGILTALDHAGVRFARIRKRLPLPVLNIQQPFLLSRPWKVDRDALAVVKDMSGLVDDEVGERIVISEVLCGHVAGGFVTQPDEAGRVRRQ